MEGDVGVGWGEGGGGVRGAREVNSMHCNNPPSIDMA